MITESKYLTAYEVEELVFECSLFHNGKVVEVKYCYLQLALIRGWIPPTLEQFISSFIKLGKRLRKENWQSKILPFKPYNDFVEYDFFKRAN